jgi:hypothetical protein
MAMPDEMLDADRCRQKELEYSDKARASTTPALKSAYEATAREYHRRVELLTKQKSA